MTTYQFYQIASCASMIQDLASEGAMESNALRIELDNCDIEKANGRYSNFVECVNRAKEIELAKAKIEERIQAKNEELQKLIADSELVKVKFTYKDKFGKTGADNIEIAKRDSELAIATFEKKHPDIVWRNFEFL